MAQLLYDYCLWQLYNYVCKAFHSIVNNNGETVDDKGSNYASPVNLLLSPEFHAAQA